MNAFIAEHNAHMLKKIDRLMMLLWDLELRLFDFFYVEDLACEMAKFYQAYNEIVAYSIILSQYDTCIMIHAENSYCEFRKLDGLLRAKIRRDDDTSDALHSIIDEDIRCKYSDATWSIHAFRSSVAAIGALSGCKP